MSRPAADAVLTKQPPPSVEPLRYERARRVDVRHDVDVPRAGPLLVGRLESEAAEDAGVGDEQVDRIASRGDQRRDVLGVGRIAGDVRDATGVVSIESCRRRLETGRVEVADDDRRTGFEQPLRDRLADATGRTSDDRVGRCTTSIVSGAS